MKPLLFAIHKPPHPFFLQSFLMILFFSQSLLKCTELTSHPSVAFRFIFLIGSFPCSQSQHHFLILFFLLSSFKNSCPSHEFSLERHSIIGIFILIENVIQMSFQLYSGTFHRRPAQNNNFNIASFKFQVKIWKVQFYFTSIEIRHHRISAWKQKWI